MPQRVVEGGLRYTPSSKDGIVDRFRHSPGGVLPARTTVITGLPREGLLVEIDALAVTD
jgi:hypothetical protein